MFYCPGLGRCVPRHRLDGYKLLLPNWIILNNEPYGTFTFYYFSEMSVAQCQRSFSPEVCANGADGMPIPGAPSLDSQHTPSFQTLLMPMMASLNLRKAPPCSGFVRKSAVISLVPQKTISMSPALIRSLIKKKQVYEKVNWGVVSPTFSTI